MAHQLNWIRYDTGTPFHPKMLELAAAGEWRAITVWHFSLGYCGLNSTAGFIPSTALSLIQGRVRDANKLVEVGLWEKVPGGYAVHNWELEQLSDASSMERRERAQKAAKARWDKEKGRRGSLRSVEGEQ